MIKANNLFQRLPARINYALLFAILILLVGSPTACQSSGSTDVSEPPGTQANSESTKNPLPAEATKQNGAVEEPKQETAVKEPETDDEIQAKWQSSAHAASFVVDEEGKNAPCAQCHAPVNWVPSMDSMPESCYSCKFEIDPPPPLVAEKDWKNIECNVCHKVKKKQVQAEIAWLEIPPIAEYAEVGSPTELCLKCHQQTDPLDQQHVNIVVAGAHQAMGCNDCHDSHDLTASCATAGCHLEMEANTQGIAGHDDAHARVSCSACHDADGLAIGPDESGFWVTFRPQAPGSMDDQVSFSSHNTVVDAPCERCHFQDNPWDLKLVEEPAS